MYRHTEVISLSLFLKILSDFFFFKENFDAMNLKILVLLGFSRLISCVLGKKIELIVRLLRNLRKER